jgi:hypothetical protein
MQSSNDMVGEGMVGLEVGHNHFNGVRQSSW